MQGKVAQYKSPE